MDPILPWTIFSNSSGGCWASIVAEDGTAHERKIAAGISSLIKQSLGYPILGPLS